MYKAARRGDVMEPPAPRNVVVHSIDLVAFDPPFVTLDVECGKGFYVRSLAYDLGAALGVGGTLAFADCSLRAEEREVVRARAVFAVAG